MEVGQTVNIDGEIYRLAQSYGYSSVCNGCAMNGTPHCTNAPAYHCTDVPAGFWVKAGTEEDFVPENPEIISTFEHKGVQFELMVAMLVKPGHSILESLTPEKADLLHVAVGVAGEAGELLDAVKKHVVYNKPIDRANVVEELGDLEFYMEGIRRNLGITREETLVATIEKLVTGEKARYKDGYSDMAAQQRADKQ